MQISISTPKLHSLAHSGYPLGVECTCGRRSLLSAAQVGARDGNMTEIRNLRLKCTGCDSRSDWTGAIFSAQKQFDDFEARPIGVTTF